MLGEMWKISQQAEIGRTAWFVLVVRQALPDSFLYFTVGRHPRSSCKARFKDRSLGGFAITTPYADRATDPLSVGMMLGVGQSFSLQFLIPSDSIPDADLMDIRSMKAWSARHPNCP